MALSGPKLHLKVGLGFILMLGVPLAIFFAPRTKAAPPRPPAPASFTPQTTEVTIEPHSTWWSMFQPSCNGELTFTLEAGENEVGMNASPVGEDGFTAELDSKMRDSQIEVPPGKKNEMKVAVTAQRRYAIYVINETDVRANAKSTVLIRPSK